MCPRYRQMYWSWREISSWKNKQTKKNNLLFAKVLVFSILEFFLPLLTLCVSSRIFCFYTISALFKYAQAYLVTFQYSSSSQGLIYWPCVLSGSRALARRGASRPAEWGRKTSPETWTAGKRKGRERERERERENLQCCHSDTFPVVFVSHDDATVQKKQKKNLWKNLIKWRQSQVKRKNVSVLNCVKWVIFNPPNWKWKPCFTFT